jgi:hypothetical protein
MIEQADRLRMRIAGRNEIAEIVVPKMVGMMEGDRGEAAKPLQPAIGKRPIGAQTKDPFGEPRKARARRRLAFRVEALGKFDDPNLIGAEPPDIGGKRQPACCRVDSEGFAGKIYVGHGLDP